MKIASFRPYSGPAGNYQFYLKYQGRQYTKVVKTKREGVLWREQKKQALRSRSSTNPDLMFSKVCEAYLEHCEGAMRWNTVREKLRHLSEFAAYMKQDFNVAELTLDICRQFIATLNRSKGAKTANRYLRNLRACWNWHRSRLPINVWNNVEKYPEEELIPHFPSMDDYVKVRKHANDVEGAFLDMITLTGARRGEVLCLKWKDIDFERRVITLHTRKRKGGDKKGRPAIMTDRLYVLLQKMSNEGTDEYLYVFTHPEKGTRFSPHCHFIRNMLQRLCKKAKVEEFGYHSLRRFMAHYLDRSGKAQLTDIQHYMGHQKVTTTARYLQSRKPTWLHLRDVINGVGLEDVGE